MKCNINGKEYLYRSDIKDMETIRKSFDALSERTFGLSFEGWYQNQYWGDDYIPHVLMDDQTVVANVSVNIIKTSWNNQKKCYLQLGTVMSDVAYRNQGLIRFLLEQIFINYKDTYDAMYLFANDDVIDFYPKFGFVKATEYQSSISLKRVAAVVKKLNVSKQQDRSLLLHHYKTYGNPYSALPMIDNTGLLMFYCSQFMTENIYYIAEYQAVVIAEYTEYVLLCYDVYGDGSASITQVISGMLLEPTSHVKFGFSLLQPIGDMVQLKQEDTTLFVLHSKENLFSNHKLMFPLLSHA